TGASRRPRSSGSSTASPRSPAPRAEPGNSVIPPAADRDAMHVYRLANDGLTAVVTPFGATLVDLRLAGWEPPLVLGFERLDDYALTDHYAGAVIGRVANRIAKGRAVVNGTTIELPLHQSGHHLHGGPAG